MQGNNFWLALHLILALMGTIEWFSASVARAMAGLQQSLLDIVAVARGDEIAASIVNAVDGRLRAGAGASFVVAVLLALATYSSVEMLRPRTVLGWAESADECVSCAAISLMLGIVAARWIVSEPYSRGSLFSAILGFAIRGGLGMVLVLAVAAVAGFLSFELLGPLRWLLALVVLLCIIVWPMAFVAQAIFDLAPQPVDTSFWDGARRWSGRILVIVGLLGVGLLLVAMLTRSAVSLIDQIALAGVLLPLLAAMLMLVGSAATLLLGSMFVTSVKSAEHVLRVLVAKKVNIGYTLLGIELFFKEVLTLI